MYFVFFLIWFNLRTDTICSDLATEMNWSKIQDEIFTPLVPVSCLCQSTWVSGLDNKFFDKNIERESQKEKQSNCTVTINKTFAIFVIFKYNPEMNGVPSLHNSFECFYVKGFLFLTSNQNCWLQLQTFVQFIMK